MMEITVLLVVFVLSLIIGILLLDLTSPKGTISIQHEVEDVESRLNRLERLVMKGGDAVIYYNIKEKLHKLDNFKANTEVELEGLKEIVDDVKEFATKGKIKKKRKPKTSKQEQLEAKKMSRMVFNSG